MAKNKRHSAGGSAPRTAQLNEQTLTALTAKIEKNLDKNAKDDNSNKTKKRKHTSEGPPASPRHRKKQAQGRQDSTTDVRDVPTKTQGSKGGPLSRDALLEEIRALGGDEEDLDLIEDIDSDQEEAGEEKESAVVDSKLKGELAAFAAQLGFQQYHDQATADDDDQNDEDHEVDEAEAADSEANGDSVEEETTFEAPARKQIKDASKKQFVSINSSPFSESPSLC